MADVESFLSKSEEQQIVDAIKLAEKNTSGEIRIHIEKTTIEPPLQRALEVFNFLKMDNTELRNGVLIYIATDSKKVAIYGDSGINEKVPNDFWKEEIELITAHFKKGKFAKGLEIAVLDIGKKLKTFYPYQVDDTDELTNQISKG